MHLHSEPGRGRWAVMSWSISKHCKGESNQATKMRQKCDAQPCLNPHRKQKRVALQLEFCKITMRHVKSSGPKYCAGVAYWKCFIYCKFHVNNCSNFWETQYYLMAKALLLNLVQPIICGLQLVAVLAMLEKQIWKLYQMAHWPTTVL